MIQHSKTTLDQADVQAVIDQLQTGIVSDDESTRRFERAFSQYIDCLHASAMSSGTLALYVALQAVGVQQNDFVIIPSYVCRDVLSAVRQLGAKPILADVNEYGHLTYESVAHVMQKGVKAIICVHLFGLPAEVELLLDFNIPVIEDCAHAIGATVNDKKVGSFGHVSVFSFHGIKMLACGEGGMVVTNNESVWQKLQEYRNPDYHKEQYKLKFPLSGLLAALGCSQLNKMDSMVMRRRRLASHYNNAFAQYPQLGTPTIDYAKSVSSVYRYCLSLSLSKDTDMDDFITQMAEEGIVVRRPIIEPLHETLHLDKRNYPFSEQLYRNKISLPLYPLLTDEEQIKIIEVVLRVLAA
ncbi:MAG: DegT/DnrJ/EryC1/StrS family aminotransferase [bacterium]